jgi:RNA polymerase sigma-70 factor (ECF subfamily)
MTREAELASAYDAARPRLNGVAYAILGSYAEAEDVVADCWLRLVGADAREPVRDVDAWATVAVARAALDQLRSARKRRETYPGPWLPEPLVAFVEEQADPADRITLDDTVRYALMIVLEALSPAERTAWVLHEVFGMPFPEVARAVGRSPAAVRKLASRARAHLLTQAPRVEVDRDEHDTVVRGFLAAAAGGDFGVLLAALDPDVVLTSDGGGEVSAALRPVVGADRVTRMLLGVLGRLPEEARFVPISINGDLGVGVLEDGRLTTTVALTLAAGRVIRLDMVRSPAKLRRTGPGRASDAPERHFGTI